MAIHLKTGIAVVLIFASIAFQDHTFAQQDDTRRFENWLDALRQEAVERGHYGENLRLAFSEIKAPVRQVITNDRNQAEFVQTYADYLDSRVSSWKQIRGREMMHAHGSLLREIAVAYGVQPRFIVAIWGMETNFGTYPIKEPLFSVLATLAYDDRRADFFRAQFFDALKILDSGFPPYAKLKSSMAGAMGQSQFIPENYLRFAVDHDGDGKRDIWDTEADVFASIANYLAAYGWRADETWGRTVRIPAALEAGLLAGLGNDVEPVQHCRRYRDLNVWKDLQAWQDLGVRRMDGSDLPVRSIPAALVTADPGDREGYLVYRNFCSIMSFNPAFKYALSIGLLADLI